MNYDKKLAKYAKRLENPKYYGKIVEILVSAKKKHYSFKQFNEYDLELIKETVSDFFNNHNYRECDRIIKYCNKYWFVVSDRNRIIFITPYTIGALIFWIKGKFLINYLKIRQFFLTDRIITINNLKNDFCICRGAIKTCDFLEITLDKLDDYIVDEFKVISGINN